MFSRNQLVSCLSLSPFYHVYLYLLHTTHLLWPQQTMGVLEQVQDESQCLFIVLNTSSLTNLLYSDHPHCTLFLYQLSCHPRDIIPIIPPNHKYIYISFVSSFGGRISTLRRKCPKPCSTLSNSH